ncbi:MAG: FHA domain-containing protein, partial [Polyangiales bacterium]
MDDVGHGAAILCEKRVADLHTVDASTNPARLVVCEEEGTREVALRAQTLSIGSAPECEIVISAAWIAARHARLALVAGAHHV